MLTPAEPRFPVAYRPTWLLVRAGGTVELFYSETEALAQRDQMEAAARPVVLFGVSVPVDLSPEQILAQAPAQLLAVDPGSVPNHPGRRVLAALGLRAGGYCDAS